MQRPEGRGGERLGSVALRGWSRGSAGLQPPRFDLSFLLGWMMGWGGELRQGRWCPGLWGPVGSRDKACPRAWVKAVCPGAGPAHSLASPCREGWAGADCGVRPWGLCRGGPLGCRDLQGCSNAVAL